MARYDKQYISTYVSICLTISIEIGFDRLNDKPPRTCRVIIYIIIIISSSSSIIISSSSSSFIVMFIICTSIIIISSSSIVFDYCSYHSGLLLITYSNDNVNLCYCWYYMYEYGVCIYIYIYTHTPPRTMAVAPAYGNYDNVEWVGRTKIWLPGARGTRARSLLGISLYKGFPIIRDFHVKWISL